MAFDSTVRTSRPPIEHFVKDVGPFSSKHDRLQTGSLVHRPTEGQPATTQDLKEKKVDDLSPAITEAKKNRTGKSGIPLMVGGAALLVICAVAAFILGFTVELILTIPLVLLGITLFAMGSVIQQLNRQGKPQNQAAEARSQNSEASSLPAKISNTIPTCQR